MTTNAVIDCSSIAAPNVTINGAGGTAYTFTPRGIRRPAFRARRHSAFSSPHVAGRLDTSAVLDESQLIWEVMVSAETTGALSTAVDALVAAVTQFNYTVTVTIDGAVKTYSAWMGSLEPASEVLQGDVQAHVETWRISIPVVP